MEWERLDAQAKMLASINAYGRERKQQLEDRHGDLRGDWLWDR